MNENKYTATPSGHVEHVSANTKILVGGSVATVGSLPVINGKDGHVYRVVMSGDSARAVEGMKFETGDTLCVREGDAPQTQWMLTGTAVDVGQRVERKAQLYSIGTDGVRNHDVGFDFVDVF